MARRRKSGDGGAGALVLLLLAIVATLIIAATVLGAAFALGLWLFYEWQATQVRRTPLNDLVNFSALEAAELTKATSISNQCEIQIAQIQTRGAHLQRRNDGYFDARSPLGRQLNDEWVRAESALDAASEQVSRVASLPTLRLAQYKSAVVNASSLRLAILGGLGCFVVTVQNGFNGLDSLGRGLGEHSFIDFLPAHREYYGHIFVAVAFTFLLWGVLRPLFSSIVNSRAIRLGYAP